MKGKTNSRLEAPQAKEYVNIRILSNQPSLSDLLGLKVCLSYGDVEEEHEWNGGEMTLSVPVGESYTVSFGEVEGYKTPESVSFTSVDDNARMVDAIYYAEHVTVNVSTDNGYSTDGQTVSVVTDSSIPNGVYIEDTNGYLWTTDMWNGEATPNGIAVISDDCRFVIALTEASSTMAIHSSPDGALDNYMTAISDETQAKADYNGATNTANIMKLQPSTDYAAGWCNAYTFPSGKKGFLPSCGQWWVAYRNKAAIDAALTKAGGTALASAYYWTSTFWGVDNDDSRYCWYIYWSSGGVNIYALHSQDLVRAFSALTATKLHTNKTTQYTVSGSKVEFNMPHGKSYTVSLSEKDGYSTPPSQTYTASEVARDLFFEYKAMTDLSKVDIYGNPIARNTANCYVIKEAGQYKFPIAYGAAIKNGATNTEAYTNNGGANSHDFVNYLGNVISSPYVETDTAKQAASVQISIADTDNAVTDLQIVDGDDCRYVKFTVPSLPPTGANAVISVKDSDGVIMWSWHIWLWADDLSVVEITNATNVKYKILPVNLGSKWDEDSKEHIKNWFYQFGRPTPLLCPSAYNSNTDHASYGTLGFIIASAASNLFNGIQNPTTFYKYEASYYNWFSINASKAYNLWDAACTATGNSDNDVVKTVYDPCPIGFKMPNGNTFTYFSTSNVVGSFANGWKFKRNSDDTVGVFFPVSGGRSYNNGLLAFVGSYGSVRFSSNSSLGETYRLRFSLNDVSHYGVCRRADSFSVRPVQDTDLALPTHKLTINVSGDSQSPSGYEVKVYSVTESTDETTGEVTETLGDVLATQTTASATHELIWGTKYKIVCGDAEGFATPAVSQTYVADVEYRTYDAVYVYDPGLTTPTNGVWIQSVDGKYYSEDDWDGSKVADCVAVVTSNCRFGIALTEASSTMAIHSSTSGALDNYMTAITDETQAKADYDGATNTTNIMKLQNGTNYAAGWCNAFSFPSGKKGFLPSLGQWWAAYNNKAAVDAALTKAGGTALASEYYWTSTFWGVDNGDGRLCWVLRWSDGFVNGNSLGGGRLVRAFSAL